MNLKRLRELMARIECALQGHGPYVKATRFEVGSGGEEEPREGRECCFCRKFFPCSVEAGP